MNIIPRRLIRQDLDLVDVFIEDTENEFIVVKDIPDVFSQGRNTFKIFGSDFLKEGIKLKIEILDRLGNTIFVNPIKYRLNQYGLPTLPYSYVSVEVYRPPINVGGAATLTILAELDEDKVPFSIPIDFIGTYNVRFQQKINIDVSKVVNTSPILFYKKPKITAQEIVKKRLVAPGTLTAATVTVSGSGLTGKSTRTTTPERYYPNPQNTTTTDTGETQQDTAANNNLMEDNSDLKDGPGGNITEILNIKEFKTGEQRVPSQFARIATPRLFLSEEPPVMKIRATGSGTFNSKMVGATIKIPKESITVFYPQQYIGLGNVGVGTGFGSFPQQADLPGGDANLETAGVFITDYTGSVERVVNDKEIHLKEPFYFRYGPGGSHPSARYYLADFGNNPYIPESAASSQRANFTMSFVDNVAATTSSFAFDSFIDLTIKNARTFSGDVYRVRVSGGSMTRISDFPVLLETVLESPQLLVDTDSPSGVKRTGYFQNQAHIDQYWNNQFGMTSTYDNTKFIDSVKLSGSYGGDGQNGSFLLDKTETTFTVDKDVAYELSFRVFGKKGPKVQPDGSTKEEAKIFFHISGSNIAGDTNPKYANAKSYGSTIRDENGNKIGLYLGDSDPSELTYEKVSHAFTIPFKLNRISNNDTVVQLRVESGEWIIQDISLRPALDTGFSPDQFKIRVPLPTNTQRPDRFRFILNYYTQDNVEAEEISEIKDVEVQGEALLIQGDDNLVKGTVTIGNVQGEGVEIRGGNSAYIRALGYTGFTDASAGTGGGFFLWSGSVAPGGETQDNYTGAGLEIHDGNTGDNESFFKFRTKDADNNNNSTFDVKTSRFFLGATGSAFISGSVGNIQISSSNLHLTADGNITASNFLMNSGVITDSVQILGSVSANSILTPASIGGAPANVLNASSSIKSDGLARFVSASIGGFQVSENKINSTNENLILSSSGDITGSQVLLTGGTIGGFTLTSTALTGGSAGTTVALTPGTGIHLGNASFASAPFSVTNAGVLTATSGEIGGFSIGSATLTGGSGGTTVALTPGTGIHLGNASFASAPFSVTNAGVLKAESGVIGGFTITSTNINSNNLILGSAGEIQTANFEPRLSGFRISALGNGTAEFENVRIRGTLKTTTFEKETVNAVGGRLYIANSTVLSSSVSASDTALKVENASGFEVDEIIFAKKVTGTGFTKEFMKITSISRQDPADDTDFTGFLHVERGFGGPATASAITDTGTDLNGGITKIQTSLTVDGNDARDLDKRMIKIDNELMMVSGSPSATVLQVHRGVDGSIKATHADDADIFVLDKDSAFLFGLVSPQEAYTEGQVLVSTGRYISGDAPNTVGSGFIELNANPTTGDTPFIEMVERTGSGIYDMERRLVLGDLSGFVGSAIGTRVSLPNSPGFGLASENVFLSGLIQASSGSIGGIKMESNKVFTGTGTHGNSNTGFFADSSGNFSLGSKFKFTNSTGELKVTGSNVLVETPSFFLGATGSAFVSGSDGNIQISSSNLHLTAQGNVTASNFLMNSGVIRDTVQILGSVTANSILTPATIGGSASNVLNASSSISSQGFAKFVSASIAGFVVNTEEIKSSNNNLRLKSTGEITASSAQISGNITATSGKIAEFNIQSDGQASASLRTNTGTSLIFAGTNTFGASGVHIAVDDAFSNPRFFVGRGTGKNIKFDSGDLTLTGDISFRTGSIGQHVKIGKITNSDMNFLSGGERTGILVGAGGSAGMIRVFDTIYDGISIDSNATLYGASEEPSVTGIGTRRPQITMGHDFTSPSKLIFRHSGGGTKMFVYNNASHNTSNADEYIRLQPGQSGSVTLCEDGNTGVGIGTKIPQELLHVNGSVRVGNGSEDTPALYLGSTDDGFYHLTSGDAGINVIVNNVQEFLFADGGGFHADADITAFSTTVDSDIRLKENIKPLEKNLEKVLQLKPSSFRWKIQDRENDIGLIAQDVEKVIPELVKEKSSIGKTKEFLDGDKHKTVDYSKLTTFLIGAVQEQQKQIDELKKKLEEL